MAKYQLTAPDGSKWELEAPDSASESEVLAFAQTSWADNAKTAKEPKTAEDFARRELESMGAGDRFDLAVGGGMYKGWLGAKDLAADAGLYGDPQKTQAAIDENEKFMRPIEDTTAGKFGSIVGQALPVAAVASQVPIAGAGALARYGSAAIGGGAQGAITAAPTGESRTQNVALGAAGGVAGQAAFDVLSPLIVAGVKKAGNILSKFKAAPNSMQIEAVLSSSIGKADWDAMTADAKKAAIDLANDPATIQALGQQGIANKAVLDNLPVPITKATQGQITGSFDQLRTEDMLAKQAMGQPIRDVLDTQDNLLKANIDEIGKSGLQTRNTSETGRVIRGALEKKNAIADAATTAKYNFARNSSGDIAVDVTPLRQYLASNQAAAISESSLKSINAQLDGIVDQNGYAALKDLEGIRKLAQNLSKDSSSGHYMGQVKNFVDDIEQNAGSDAYKAAISQAKASFREFDNRAVASKLLSNASRKSIDPKVADEDVFNAAVLNSSDQQFKDLKRTLLSANEKTLRGAFRSNAEARKAGLDAYKSIRGETARYILEKSTANQQGTVSEAALRKAVNDIGDEKLKDIFGPQGAKQLRMLVKAAKIVKVKPTGATNPSGSGDRIIAFLERYLPGGQMTSATIKAVAEPAKAALQSGRAASGADPLINATRNNLIKRDSVYGATNALIRGGTAGGAIELGRGKP